jgi:hypothetical protein
MHTKFWSGNLKGRDHLGDLGINGKEIGWYGVHWIHLAQDRDQWRAVVYTVINLRVP